MGEVGAEGEFRKQALGSQAAGNPLQALRRILPVPGGNLVVRIDLAAALGLGE